MTASDSKRAALVKAKSALEKAIAFKIDGEIEEYRRIQDQRNSVVIQGFAAQALTLIDQALAAEDETTGELAPDKLETIRAILGLAEEDETTGEGLTEAVKSILASKLTVLIFKGIVKYAANDPRTSAQECAELVADQIVDLIAALTAAERRGMNEWRDMASAPKDGTRIQVWDHGAWPAAWSEECQHGRFETKPGWQIFECDDPFYSIAADNPTHWRPLPEPPLSQVEQEEA